MIERREYYDRISSFINQPLIKVITGIRRSGKSTLLNLVQKHLIDSGISDKNIIYINFESMKYYEYRDAKKLYDYITKIIKEDEMTYLFFDEIQLVNSWEEAINSFMVDFNVDIYITGTNSNLLSSELSTLLSGRYIQLQLQPLSFSEMVEFYKVYTDNDDKEDLLWRYIRRGGFPLIHIAD